MKIKGCCSILCNGRFVCPSLTMDTQSEQHYLASYKAHSDALFRYCYGKLGDRELAKDLTQDIFMKTWQYIAGGKKIENLKSFLFRTAHNAVIDEYRKKKTTSLDVMRDDGFDPSDANDAVKAAEHMHDGKQAIELIQKLPDTYRDAVYLQYVEQLSIREIADILDESENNISVRIFRGIEKLKEMINHERS